MKHGEDHDARFAGVDVRNLPAPAPWYAQGGDVRVRLFTRDITGVNPRDVAMRHIVAALDHVEEAIVVLSADRTVQYLNRAADEMLAHDEEVEVPLPWNAWEQVDKGLSWSGDVELRRGDAGGRRLRIDVQPVNGFRGEPSLLIIVHDVTDVERLQSIADSVNLSDNVGHFLSGIRHELGNPVNSIKTALTVLGSNLDSFPQKKVADYIERVLGEVGRIEYLLRSLRSFSLYESVALEQVDVAEVVHKVVALARPGVLKSKVKLAVESSPSSSVSIIADVRALYQILLNLISNAIEAQPGPADPTIRIEISVGREYVDVAVVDNGPGMSADELALAMRPFFTTKQSGTGLGLVIAQRLASNQGGRLRLYSERGEGTRAVVSLARAPSCDECA